MEKNQLFDNYNNKLWQLIGWIYRKKMCLTELSSESFFDYEINRCIQIITKTTRTSYLSDFRQAATDNCHDTMFFQITHFYRSRRCIINHTFKSGFFFILEYNFKYYSEEQLLLNPKVSDTGNGCVLFNIRAKKSRA